MKKITDILLLHFWTTILFQPELIQKAKDAVELKKREDFEMLKEQMEEALKVR